jgi:hypothetical protein
MNLNKKGKNETFRLNKIIYNKAKYVNGWERLFDRFPRRNPVQSVAFTLALQAKYSRL